MAVLAFLSCGNGSYTTPNIEGLLDKRRKSFSQRFTKKLEEPIVHWRSYVKPICFNGIAHRSLTERSMKNLFSPPLLEKQAKWGNSFASFPVISSLAYDSPRLIW